MADQRQTRGAPATAPATAAPHAPVLPL